MFAPVVKGQFLYIYRRDEDTLVLWKESLIIVSMAYGVGNQVQHSGWINPLMGSQPFKG